MTELTAKRQLETLLLEQSPAGLEPAIIKANRLGAYAYNRAEGEGKTFYKADYLAAAARHQLIKAQLLPLIRAWRAAGIEVLLFKGFYLAEFIYEDAAERFYGDVDILLRPEATTEAAEFAEALGWQVTWERKNVRLRQHVHEAFHLCSADSQLKLDVHRFPVPSFGSRHRRQVAITRSVWAKAIEYPWEDTILKVMQPVDALLVGLVLNRAWAQWGVKPHDLLDMRMLVRRYGVTRQALEIRAADLKCSATLSLYLRHCDPWTDRITLGRLSYWRRRLYELRTMRENDLLGLQRFFRKARLSLDLAGRVLQVLPTVLRIRRQLRQTRDLYALLESLNTLGASHALNAVPEEWLSTAVKWAAKLVDPFAKGSCVLRSLTLYTAMKQRGGQPVFYSGIRREGQSLTGHAWIEVNGRPLLGSGDERARHCYKINFVHPSNG